ncbi:MAG: antibiotic biosynthesis monooxygenase [Oscillospiraceae bacterium]|nr:antibiotic biosynthesis monooxygenase [Oscillospiraceae bacterium]
MNELTFLVTYFTKPGQREAFLRGLAASGVVEEIRAEEGCLQYDYYLSVKDPDEVLLAERWTCAEAQKVHMTRPHMAKVREQKEKFVDAVEIRCLAEVE